MPQSVRLIEPPSISPLREPYGTKASQIYSNTFIQISPAEAQHKVYFSTDGEDPDPWHRVNNGHERTFKYKGPFRLREGPRMVRAMSVSKRDRASSRITTKAFEVLASPDSTIREDTEEDSSTLVSVSSVSSDVSSSADAEPQLQNSSRLMPRAGSLRCTQGSLRGTQGSLRSTQGSLRSTQGSLRSPKDTNGSLHSSRSLQERINRPLSDYKDLELSDSSSLLTTDHEVSEDLLGEISTHGQRLRTLDNSLHTDRYRDIRDILDTNYNNELHHRRGDDLTSLSRNQRPHTAPDKLENHYRGYRNSSSYADPKLGGSTYGDQPLTSTSLYADRKHTSGSSYDDYRDRKRSSSPILDRKRSTSPYRERKRSSSPRTQTGSPYRKTSGSPYRKRSGSPYRKTSGSPYRRSTGSPHRDSDCETDVSNYFRRSRSGSLDRVSRTSPTSDQYTALHNQPPAFWSTQTPRVRFSEDTSDEVGQGTDPGWTSDYTDTSQDLHNDVHPRHRSNRDHMPLNGYHSWNDDKHAGRNHRTKRHVSPAHSEDLAVRDEVLHGSHDDLMMNGERGESDQRPRSPVSGLGYHAGYKYGLGYMSDPETSEKKTKKKKDKDSSSSSSSSSSDSSSGSDSDSGRKSRKEQHMKDKKKKDKKKKKKDKDKKEKKEKENKEKENEKKKDDGKSKEADGSDEDQKTEVDSLIVKTEKPKPQPSNKLQVSSGAAQKTDKSGLNFINDSGTQINFWGTPPDEVVKKVGQMIPGAKMSRISDSTPRVQPLPAPSPPTVFPQHQRPSPMSMHTLGSAPTAPQPDPRSPDAPIVQTQHQNEQHSIGGFFKKLFKIDKKEKKKLDSRSTVREADDQKDQKAVFESLRQECLDADKLYEDPDFKAEDSSVYFNQSPVDGDIEWKRPKDICDDPEMFVGGASRFDVKQGVLGNCWLLAAVASLTTNEKLLHQVVPPDQTFTDKYAGIFRFRFWQYGRWVEVVIDDRLPTSNGELVFMHSEQGNEFWSPLMEKAYAKLCGCYENLSGGLASEAMTDFTGGVTERLNFREELPDNMFQMMLKASERKSLMGCSIDAAPDEMEAELENGLIKGHAYSITSVKLLETDDGEVELVRVRNPWGNECEWKGAWGDQSDEWEDVSDDVKQSLGIQFDHDGEFWMSFRDFSTHFQRMEICHLNPDSLGSDDGSTKWMCTQLNGAWKKNVTAGGCRNFPKSYYTNPQYRVQITDADDDDEEEIGTIIVGLMQQGRRKLRAEGGGNLTMGYEVFSTEGVKSKKSLDRDFFKKNKPVATSAYINMREVCTRHRLPPGDYCVVLTTFEPNEEADYLLRLYSEKPGAVMEADEDTSIVQAKNVSVVHSAPGPTREAEKQFKKYGGEDEEIDSHELQEVLNNVYTKDFDFGGFDTSLCRSMVAMTDDDRTGKLTLPEFKLLWQELQKCKEVFKKYDADQSGQLNSFELREALKHCGYTVSNATFESIVMRFSNRDGNLSFGDFVACVIRLRTLYRIFTSHEQQESATFTLDAIIKQIIYS